MKESIKLKLFLSICLLVLSFVILSWALNTKYLEVYYIAKKKEILIKTQQRINELYHGDPQEIAIELERIENTLGTSVIILNQNLEVKYSTFARAFNRRPLNFFYSKNPVDNQNQEYLFKVLKDPQLKIDFLQMTSMLDTGEIILLRVALVSISESAQIANDFLILIGIVIIILGSIWAYLFSNRFTKPILALNRIARHMANLDFSQKYQIQSDDEIGQLGKSINYLSSQLDSTITALNQKNERLAVEIQKERKIDEIRKQFISNVSHELKTPLSLIQGYAEGLRENIVEDEESKNYYCDVIIDETNKMNRLVKDLLNLSQFESGFFKLEKSIFDITYLLEQTLFKYQRIFEEKEIQLNVFKIESCLVNADIIRIEQILVNYLNNALNHVDATKQIKINMIDLKDKIKISIFNSGKHIPDECLDRIWTSFYKVDEARTRDYGGYGLGLSIVRAIQELHHNAYGVSNIEEGVLFWFEVDKAPK